MRVLIRLIVVSGLALLGWTGSLVAPTAGADCNDSSGTTVCSQGEIRGTHAPPPERPARGAFGTFCSGGSCYGDFGFGNFFGP